MVPANYRLWAAQTEATFAVKWVVRMMEIRWMNSDVNRPDGVDERRRRRRW